MATSGSSNDTRNFQCVTVASVDVIKLPLSDILASHIKPIDLYHKIKSSSTLKLRPDQLKICFIPPPGVPDYKKFDVTLLYTLIRNLCSLPCPAQGWGNEPRTKDTQVSDDIERLRLFRNNYYAHAESAMISDAVFEDVWKNLKLVFKRIQPKTGRSVDYEQALINIERIKFTDDCLTTLRVLLETFAKLEKQTDGRDEPDFFIHGQNEIICGSTAQIEAEVKKVESSCWSITWRKRRGDVIKCIDTYMEKYSGSTKKKLVIQSVCKEDEGEYQAVLLHESNGPEYKSRNTIRLHAVGEIPFLTISEVSSGSEGITIHFNCEVLEQSPKVHLIEWSKNGKQLDNKSNKYVGEGIDSTHLTITSPTYEDRGNYNCKVSNAVGSVSKNVMLDVPSVELLEVSPIFCGSKTTIKSVISSTPTPENIEWQTSRDGVDFHSMKKTKYFDNTDSSFVIHKATFADKLYYRLRVWNGIGETISNMVYLNVTGSPPNIKTIPETNIKNRSVKLIGNVIIYDDSPGVKNFFWSRNYKTIDFEECDGRLSETRTDNPSLTITNVGPDDAGEYRLTAMNDVGSFTSEAIILGAPRVSEEKIEDENNGGQRITVTIKSIPEPCHVQWSAKKKEDDTFVQIDIYAKEYEGTTVNLPHPVLFVKQEDQLENICFRIEVTNFIGNTQQDISGNNTTKQRKIDSVENTIYNDDGKIFEFTILSSTLVKQFPLEKLDRLKFLIKNSNKVKNLTSVKEATSVLECIEIIQDENLFTPTDVIYMQFLCQEADCFDLFTKCVEYAECKQRALCYFKKPPANGYKDVQFHVQGDVSGYTRDYINHVIKTVAVILRCKEEDVLLNGAQHSQSFLLSLSVKEPYGRKLLALKEKDRLKLRRLNIDYLIIDGEILDIEIPKDQGFGRKEQSSCKEVTPVSRMLQKKKNQPHGEILKDSSDNWFTDAKMSVNRDHNKDDTTDEDLKEYQQRKLIRSSSFYPNVAQRPLSNRSKTRLLRITSGRVKTLPQVGCNEYIKFIPVFSCHDIEAGDHVVFSGDHHGIIVSNLDDDETVSLIEETNTIFGAVLGKSNFFGSKGKITFSLRKFDFNREKICVVVYRHRYSNKDTVRRAFSLYNRNKYSRKDVYGLFGDNYENFATYCVTGHNFSLHVSTFRLTWMLDWSFEFLGVSDELKRNETQFENCEICDNCYEINKKLLDVSVNPIVSEGDVQKGDIIRYSYWSVWHDAVVLEVNKRNKNAVVCSIAHYAFCGLLALTIKEETTEIPFNGQSFKLDYAPPQYDVYEPETVVKRARKRLGEQLFVFFSNNSSHFARWCKLKLRRS